MSMPPFILYSSRPRLLMGFLGSAAFALCSIWLLLQPDLPIKPMVFAWLCATAFGLLAGFFFKRLVLRRPAVVLDELGITVNASWFGVGFIPWSDVANAGVTSYRKQRLLGISLHNSEKYLVKTGFVKRYFMRENATTIGYAVSIPEITLSMSVDELLEHVRRYFKAYKN